MHDIFMHVGAAQLGEGCMWHCCKLLERNELASGALQHYLTAVRPTSQNQGILDLNAIHGDIAIESYTIWDSSGCDKLVHDGMCPDDHTFFLLSCQLQNGSVMISCDLATTAAFNYKLNGPTF